MPNGKTVTLKKAKGNSHGGKAFSAGDVWKGTTSSGNNSSEIIVGVPGDNAKWMVGKHGNYQGPYNFSDIEKGSGLFVPFDAEGVADISTEGLKYFKPSVDISATPSASNGTNNPLPFSISEKLYGP